MQAKARLEESSEPPCFFATMCSMWSVANGESS